MVRARTSPDLDNGLALLASAIAKQSCNRFAFVVCALLHITMPRARARLLLYFRPEEGLLEPRPEQRGGRVAGKGEQTEVD